MKAFCRTCGEVRDIPFQRTPGEPRPTCETCGTPLVKPPAVKKPRPPRRQPERLWDKARAKVADERACRFCGTRLNAEHLHACHVIGRDRDAFDPVTREPREQPWVVEPDRIVPGCSGCHVAYDMNEIDLLGKLTLEEELQAVRDSYPPVRGSGIEHARLRTAPTAYRQEAVA